MRRKPRKGLVIRGQRGHPVVREAFKRFAVYARERFEFPIRVPVYLGRGLNVRTRSGERVSAIFFGPYSRIVEPYIRVATGDYPELRKKMGRHGALAVTLHSLCHELVHYQQWWTRTCMTERGAEVRATSMVKKYLEQVREP